MDLEQKCAILEEFSRMFTTGDIDRDFFSDFVIYNDMGLPLAQGLAYNLCTLTEEGQKIVEETWAGLCDTLLLERDWEYLSFDEMLDIFDADTKEE